MRKALFILSLMVMAVPASVSFAQSLPEQALPDHIAPDFGGSSSTRQEETITNPGGFGKDADRQAIDPTHTGSTTGTYRCDTQKGLQAEVRRDRRCR